MTVYEEISVALAPLGLLPRGGFYPEAGDAVPLLDGGKPAKTLIMVGNAGPALWKVFPRSPEAADGKDDPLDRWTVRVLAPIAAAHGAAPFYPFLAAPFGATARGATGNGATGNGAVSHPFTRWAGRADVVAPSPIGLLIHPEHGLWHAYRGAFAFAEALPLPSRAEAPIPCVTCVEKPCLGACPVGAFADKGYDVPVCGSHLAKPAGKPCLEGGCLARRACPVAPPSAPAQAAFHMGAFFRSLRRAGYAGNE